MHLDIGSGERPFNASNKNWIHLDQRALPDIECLADQRHLPFRDCSIESIRSSHTIEHEWFNETISMLKEWRRVLRRSGYAHIICPNLFRMAKQISDDPDTLPSVVPGIYGAPTFGDNETHLNTHRAGFSPKSLSQACYSAGFELVDICGNSIDCEVIAFKVKPDYAPRIFRATHPISQTNYTGKGVVVIDTRNLGDVVSTCGIIHCLRICGANHITLITRHHPDNSLWRDNREIDLLLEGDIVEGGVMVSSPFLENRIGNGDTILYLNDTRTLRTSDDVNFIDHGLCFAGVDPNSILEPHRYGHIEIGAHVEGYLNGRLTLPNKFIVLHPQSRILGKSTIVTADMIKHIEAVTGLPVLLIGLDINLDVRMNLTQLKPLLSLDSCAKLIDLAKGVICVDSVFLHVASALKKPTALIIGQNAGNPYRRVHKRNNLAIIEAEESEIGLHASAVQIATSIHSVLNSC